MSSYNDYEARINRSDTLAEEEELILEDDLKVVEITEEVDVSMHIGENGNAYLQDVNGVQWNLENPSTFRLNDLPWKPLEDSIKTEVEDDYVDSVRLVTQCVNCKGPLTSGALCIKCNQPWVALTDIYKTKDYIKEKQIIPRKNEINKLADAISKKFYILKKSDVKKFVNKNMGKLNVINQYETSNMGNLKVRALNNDSSAQTGVRRKENNNIKQNYVSSSNECDVNKRNKGKSNDSTSGRSVRKNIFSNTDNEQNEEDREINFVSVDIDSLIKIKKEMVDENDDTEEPIKRRDVNKFYNTRGTSTYPKMSVTESDVNLQETSIGKSRSRRRSALNHKFLNKNKNINELDTVEDNGSTVEETVTENIEKVMRVKAKVVFKKRYLCIACYKSFRKYDELHHHMERHPSPYGCLKCKVKLLSEAELIAHSVVHNVIVGKNLKCKLCDKEVKNLSMLRIHSYTHVKNKEFPCEQCDASFHSMAQLRMHMIKHGILPYACDLCERKFKSSGYLRRHYCPKRWNPDPKTDQEPTVTSDT